MMTFAKQQSLGALTIWLALSSASPVLAQSAISGQWATTGFGSIVDLKPCNTDRARLCGTIIWLWEADDNNGHARRDQRNPDTTKRTKPLMGLEILTGFRETRPGLWSDGSVYNPDDGRTYSGTIQIRNDTLLMKGCALHVLCQTQTWRRPETLLRTLRGIRS